MRQRKWLELIKDYDYTINYHSGKVNVIVDALCRRERINVMSSPKEFTKVMEKLELEIRDSEHKKGSIYKMLVQLELIEGIKRINN